MSAALDRFGGRLAFVDLETTGATANTDRITEIGIIEIGPEGSREWSSLVNPQTRIPPFIQRLTGISNEMVAVAPTFAELAVDVLRRLEGRLFIAHNARFDYGFLKNEFLRAGLDFRATVLCTVRLSRRMFPQHHKHSLDALIDRHALAAEGGRHRALGDARLIWRFWNLLQHEADSSELDEALAVLLAQPSLPPQLDPAVIDDLPEAPGVYLFYGENDLPLYVGKSTNVRRRVLGHFAADHSARKEMSLARQLRRIEWVETAGDIGAQLREALLVKRLQPIHNRRLRRNDEVCAWRLDAAGNPFIVAADDADFTTQVGAGALYGPFASPREATTALRSLADAHGLCHALLGLERVAEGRPCFSRQLRNCRGACIGEESRDAHLLRLMTALRRLQMPAWPFDGPATIGEGEGDTAEVHVIDRWCHLGSARSEAEVWELLETASPRFDRDVYRLLRSEAGRMRPVLPR